MRSALRALICTAIVPCSCVEAASGEHAVALADETHPALVVMDLMMPGMNGIEATRRIKTTLPQTQIVIVSLHEALQFQTEAARAGATAYLPKRVIHRELVPLLKSLLDGDRENCPTHAGEGQAGVGDA
jgi:DNA-binding NarL/FixJ family response regulator